MVRRTVEDLKNHVSMFEPGFPIQSGYIAQLLLEHSIAYVVRHVKAIVEAAEPGKHVIVGSLQGKLSRFNKFINERKSKLTKEWPSLILLFQQPFTVPSVLPPAVTSTPPSSSSSGYPEQTSDTLIQSVIPQTSDTLIQSVIPQTSDTLIQSEIPETSNTLIQLNNTQTSTPTQTAPPNQTGPPKNSQSRSATCSSPSAIKLQRKCRNWVAIQNANTDIMRQNQNLRDQFRELKMLFVEGGQCSLTKFNEEMMRQVESVNMWKDKYNTYKTACENTPRLMKLMQVLERKVKTLEEKLIAVQVKNINKAMLIEQLKRMHEKTEIDGAHLKSYKYTTHGPEMEVSQEITWEEHPERSLWNGIADNDEEVAVSQGVVSNVSKEDLLCGDRCQVEADGEYYMQNPEVPCEHIDIEDVNPRITVENVEQPDVLSENEAASLYTKLCYASSNNI